MGYNRINEKEALILFKTETTAGTFEAPGITDWIPAFQIEGMVPDGEELENEVKCGKLGSQPANDRVGVHLPVQFSFYMTGSGTPGTPPSYGALLRAAGYREEIFADRVEYSPIDENYESGSMIGFMGPNKHPSKGMRGNVSFAVTPKKQLVATVQLDGTYITASEEVSHAVPDCNSQIKALPIGPDHTTLSMFGFADLDIYSLNIAGGRNVEFEEFITSRSTNINNREMSGDIEFAAHKLSVKDWSEAYGETGAINLVHGKEAGYIVEMELPNAQVGKHEYGTQGDYKSSKFPLNIMPLAGEDDIKIIVR